MFKNSFSKTHVVGYLAQNPELRFTNNGTPVTSIRIPVNYVMGSGDDAKEETTWHNIAIFGKMAEVIAEHLVKGSMVTVDARLRPARAWAGNDGEARASVELIADEVTFMGKKVQSETPDVTEEEIPF
jgi:single-strand DNA-binding protein